MAKSKHMRWVHRALARALALTGREEAADGAVHWADTLDRKVRMEPMGRRAALKAMGVLAALPLVGSAGCGKERRLANTTVAIVGGGLAGLTAALRLQDLGMAPVVYEASDRFGGRARTVSGVLPGSGIFEAGGEFMDAQHAHMLALAGRFGVAVDDLESLELEGMRYLFNGEEVGFDALVEATEPFLPSFLADGAALEQDYEGHSETLDALTCMEYWDGLGIAGVFRAVLEVAVLTEFGQAPSQVSALHFVEDLPQVQDGTTASDGSERFRFSGGTQALVDAMLDALGGMQQGRLVTGAKLSTISRQGRGFQLGFEGMPAVEADIVLLGVPLPAMRHINFEGLDLPQGLDDYIATAGMGEHAKVVAGFNGTPWRNAGFDGEVLTNAGCQTCWDSQPFGAGPGALTFLLGGDDAAAVDPAAAGTMADTFANQLAPLYPGLPDTRSGVHWAVNWGQEAGYGGSYTCLGRGQYTAAIDHLYFEGDPEERQVAFVDNLGFIGEAFSGDHWGYMEGAAQTGWMAARHVVDELV